MSRVEAGVGPLLSRNPRGPLQLLDDLQWQGRRIL